MITNDLINKVLAHITTKVAYDHFFNTISDPAWVKPLRDKGYFKDPPPAIREGGYISFPVWAESQLLVRLGDKVQDQSLEIIDALPDTDNERVMDDVVNILLKVDIRKAARRTELVKKYVNSSQFLMLYLPVAELICKFAENNHVSPALAIAREMLEVLPDPEKEEKLKDNYVMISPHTKYRDHDYQDIVEKITPSLAKASPMKTIDMYVELLQKAIDYELTFFKGEDEEAALKEKTDDFSYIWRPKISEGGDYRDGPRDTLTSALYDSVTMLLENASVQDSDKLTKLEELAAHKYQIFKRIVEHTLRNYGDRPPFEEFYNSLLKDKKLKAILEMGESSQFSVSFGEVTNKPTKILKDLSDDELIEKLRTYKDESQWSFERDSIAKELADLVKNNPKHFAPLVMDLATTKNEYLNETVRVFEETTDNLDEVSIVTILTSLVDIYKHAKPKEEERQDYYLWSKSNAIRLVEKLLSQKEDGTEHITQDSLDAITSLILLLCRDESLTEDDSSFNPVDLSVNSIRGNSLHAIAYLLTWMRRNEVGNAQLKPVFDELDWHLDSKNDPAPAIRAVYGWRFEVLYGVDENWAIKNIDTIFSNDELGEAAFDAYMLFNRAHPEALKILGGVFKRQILRLATMPIDDGKAHYEGLKHFVQHMALHYLHTDMDLSKGSMMSTLLNTANVEYIKELANFVGFRLYKNKDVARDEVQIQKLIDLWYMIVKLTQEDGAKVEALKEFGAWFASRKFDPKWALSQLTYAAQRTDGVHLDFAVLSYLESLAKQYPAESVAALAAMVDGSKERWAVESWNENATVIIKTAYQSNDMDVKTSAKALANKLVAMGYTDYRRIVN